MMRLYRYFIDVTGFDNYLYQFLENANIIDKEAIPNTKNMSVEELETIMKSWAASQRGE